MANLLFDREFRKNLEKQPKQYITELGYSEFEEDITVAVHKNTANIFYIIFPIIAIDQQELTNINAAVATVGSVGSVASAGTASSAFTCISSVSSASTVGSLGSAKV